MSAPVHRSGPPGQVRGRRWGGVALAAWLVVVWVALWGGVSWANLGSGVLVAAVVLALFPTGPGSGGHVSVWPALRYVAWFSGQLVVATAQVVLATVAPSGRVRPAVVAVPLRSRSALVATIVANSVTLTPGTLTVDVEPAGDGAPVDGHCLCRRADIHTRRLSRRGLRHAANSLALKRVQPRWPLSKSATRNASSRLCEPFRRGSQAVV